MRFISGLLSLMLMLIVSDLGADTRNMNFHRKYFEPLTPVERQSISYIVSSLGTKSMVALLFQKGAMEKAGIQLELVHPLLFWKEVLTHQDLRSYILMIKGIVKKKFIENFAESFADMSKLGQMDEEYIADFSDMNGISKEQINYYIANNHWKPLVEFLFNVAKQGSTQDIGS